MSDLMTGAPGGGARLLQGGPIAREIRQAVSEDVAAYVERHGRGPVLAVVIVGRDAPSMVYLGQILRSCEKVGIEGRLVEVDGEASEASVVEAIRAPQRRPARSNGIIVQMPLPPTIRLRTRRGRDRSGQGHRRHPSDQRGSPPARLRRLPAGDGPRRGRDPAPLGDRDRGQAGGRHRPVGRRRHAGRVPPRPRERDRDRLPLADARPGPPRQGRRDPRRRRRPSGSDHRRHGPSRGRCGRRRDQRRRRGDRRRRRLRVGPPRGVGDHAGPRWRGSADERAPPRPPGPRRARPGGNRRQRIGRRRLAPTADAPLDPAPRRAPRPPPRVRRPRRRQSRSSR